MVIDTHVKAPLLEYAVIYHYFPHASIMVLFQVSLIHEFSGRDRAIFVLAAISGHFLTSLLACSRRGLLIILAEPSRLTLLELPRSDCRPEVSWAQALEHVCS